MQGEQNVKVIKRFGSKLTYCKRGYFRWGKISQKCWQDISRGGNFHDTTPISFIKVYGYYVRVGVIFCENVKSRKLPPRENFHFYSNYTGGIPHTSIRDYKLTHRNSPHDNNFESTIYILPLNMTLTGMEFQMVKSTKLQCTTEVVHM